MTQKKAAAPVKKAATKAAPKTEAAKKPTPAPTRQPIAARNPKLANPDTILKKYDELIDQLAKVESAQRNKSKPFRIYFVHRRKIEVLKMNFIKSMR